MNNPITNIRGKIHELQDELEGDLAKRRQQFKYRLEQHRVVFTQEALTLQRQAKISLLRFLRESPLMVIVTAPVIYSMIIPAVLADVFVTFYQWVCFPVYGISKVKRNEYVVMDRKYLAYLNLIEKINCIYCEYANGVISYVREVACRTEQYWCPIKHTRKLKDPPQRYYDFLEYGDSKGFHEGVGKRNGKNAGPAKCPATVPQKWNRLLIAFFF